jgi:hypothetical protein
MMKKCYFLLLIPLVGIGICKGQDKVASEISLSLKDNQAVSSSITTDGIFSLNVGTQEFSGIINLFPIVPYPDAQDSLAMQDKPLLLYIKGRFPPGDISFLTPTNNTKTYMMQCSCKIYDSAKNCQLSINLITNPDQPLSDAEGKKAYQPRLSFVMVLDPKEYGLDNKPFSISKPILLVAKNAIINRSN